MDAYLWQAALWCDDCIAPIVDDLDREGAEDTGDSDAYPQGPYGDGGGEADTPQHCDGCGCFLENPLTGDGRRYVEDQLADYFSGHGGAADVLAAWADYYGFPWPVDGQPLDYASLRAEYRLCVSGDSWGDCMAARFAIAGELFARGEDIPAEWRYSPGMAGNGRDLGAGFGVEAFIAETAALERLGAVLARYDGMLRAAGRDY